MATIEDVRLLLKPTTLPADLADDLLHRAPPLWLMSEEPAVLAADLALCHPPLAPQEVRASATPRSTGAGWRLSVVAHDRAGLLADSAAALAQAGLPITSASVATWSHRNLALHSLTLPGLMPSSERLDEVGATLRSAATGDARPAMSFTPRGHPVVRRSGEADGDPMITVTAPDQLGLLWAACQWFTDTGANIQAAWATSDDITAHAVFVVTGDPDINALAERLRRPSPALLTQVGEGVSSLVGRLLRRR